MNPGSIPIDAANAPSLRVYAEDAAFTEINPARILLQDAVTGRIHEMIACSDYLLRTLQKVRLVARSKIPVLIHGETGTGKELIARILHEQSERRNEPFVQVNCAAFSETLIESELFGHEKGAFTGADQRHLGYFERANGGSILLDEIGEMPLKLQAKLLRVLEEEAFERVGGEQLLSVDLRVIATTNRELEHEIHLRQFRSDLYYRLNTMTFHLPPLRERRQEIPLLVDCFVRQFQNEGPVAIQSIAPRALAILLDYSWPGNIRQLRNVIRHACVMAQSDCIEPDDLPVLPVVSPTGAASASGQTLAQIERQHILEALQELGGNRTATALRLGITTRTLQNKLKLYRAEEAA